MHLFFHPIILVNLRFLNYSAVQEYNALYFNITL